MAILTDDEIVSLDYPLKPEEINPDKLNSKMFGTSDTAYAAKTLLEWANHHGCWKPFSQSEIDTFVEGIFFFEALVNPRRRYKLAHKQAKEGKLIAYGGGWIKLGENGRYFFTKKFVDTCHQASVNNLTPA